MRRLRAVVEAKDAEIGVLRGELAAERELRRRLELRLAEVERRLSMDSSDSGTPSSKERIGAREARQASERERRKDRKPGGQPGHTGKGLARDPDPDDRKDAEPPVQCRRCHAGLDGAAAAEPRWAQVIDAEIARTVTAWLLPGLCCPCCGTVTFAEPPPGLHAGAVSYGPVLNAAAVLLACYGNVPPERAAQVMGMLLGVPVSAGWVDKAAARTSAQLGKAGFDEAMIAALAAETVLAADETPVNVLDKTAQPAARDEQGETDPEETDGKAAAGIQQCCQHVIRRARAVTKLGPGGLQSWAGDIITILREAHKAVEDARARGSTALDPQVLKDLRERYDQAVSTGIIHNRLRDWHEGNHPGYALGCWLRDYKEQVFLFTRDFAVDWTNDLASHCTSWGCCAVFGWGGRLGWLADVILACGGDIFGGSRAAGDAVGVAAA